MTQSMILHSIPLSMVNRVQIAAVQRPVSGMDSGVSLPTQRNGSQNFGGQQVQPTLSGTAVIVRLSAFRLSACVKLFHTIWSSAPPQHPGSDGECQCVTAAGVQVPTGPVMHESGTRPVLNQQGVPVGTHAFSRSAAGSQSPPMREHTTRLVFNEGGAPVGSRSFTRAGAGSHSDKFAADRINTGPTTAGPTAADYTRTGHTGGESLMHLLACCSTGAR